MTRELNDHIINPANDQIKIEVLDAPGQGGASHHYQITGFNTQTNASDPFMERYGQPAAHSTILFQNGPIGEFGVNGITNEVLLAIVLDRLKSFQAGPFSTRENSLAITNIEQGLLWLQKRTLDRMKRGVEGTNQK